MPFTIDPQLNHEIHRCIRAIRPSGIWLSVFIEHSNRAGSSSAPASEVFDSSASVDIAGEPLSFAVRAFDAHDNQRSSGGDVVVATMSGLNEGR